MYFENEEFIGIDLGNVELKTLKPMWLRGKLYYRFMFYKKDIEAQYILIYHLEFDVYYLITQNEYKRKFKHKADNSTILQTEIERCKHKFFKNGKSMIRFLEQILNAKYLRN